MTSPGGGDYNLGRAHGEISITADTRGAQEAQAAMAATSAEAEVLDRRMGIVTQRFEENRRASVQTAEQIMKQRQQLEDLRITHERYAAEYTKATERSTRAQREFREEFEKAEPNQRRLIELGKEQERAKEQEERLLLRVTDAHTRYERKLNDVNTALSSFNRHHIEATTGLRRMSVEADRLGESLERVSDKLGSVLRIVGQGGLMGLFGLGSSSTMAAMGAGGLGQVTSALSGMVIAMQQLSGIVALIPAGIGGAVISLGTLATAFHGVKEAMGAMEDPQKFIESLRELAPAARMAMMTFYSFQDAIRGVRFAIQEATFEPFVQQLQPLIYTWLPMLQNAGVQVGRAFGGMISQVMAFMQTASAQEGFNTFVNNMVAGLQSASHAIEPLMSAFQTLSVVGSGFFERIGNAITKVADEFNNWVQGAAQSGRLQAWIDSALRAFTDLGHIVMNVGETIMNIAAIGSTHGGGFLEWLSDVTSRIRAWTESADGMQKMANFFDLLHQAGQAMTPILHLMGQALATVGGAFTRLGIEIAPAVTQFFQSIVESLHTLAPILLQMGPSISTFLVQFGQALAQLVQQAGPQLPGLFQAFTQALLLLLPIVTRVLQEVVKFVSHFTPQQMEGILLAAVAVRGLATGFGILSAVLSAGPWGIAAAAIAAIGVAAYEAYQHWEPFKHAVDGVWHMLQSMIAWVAQEFTETGALAPLANVASKAYDWGKNLVTNFISGMGDLLDDVGKTASDIGDAIDKHLHPGSPTREGPLSQDGGTENWGAKAVTGYARGMAGATPAVASASAGVGASAAGGLPGGRGTGTTGMGFSSAGGIGASGSSTSFGSDIGVGRGIGASGFDKYVDFLTKDLSAWGSILQGGFNIIRDTITNVAIPGIKLFADFWQGGNNPLTQAGGIFGPQELAGQWGMPGVENVKAPGHAPDEWARKLAAARETPGQQTPPGVTPVGPRGQARTGPGSNNPPPANNQPPPGPGSAGGGQVPGQPAGVPPIVVHPDGTISSPNPEWQRLLTRESGGRNVLQGDIPGDPNVGPNKAQGYFQITPDTWRSNGGEQFAPNPMAATPEQQAIVAGRIFAARGGQPWGAVPGGGREDEAALRAGLLPAPTQPGWVGQPGAGPISGGRLAEELNRRRNAPAGAPGGPVPGAAVNPATRANIPLQGSTTNAWQAAGSPNPPLYTPGSNTGGYGGPGQNVLPDWVKQFADKFGLVASTYPEGGTLHQAGYAFDFVPKPGNQDPAGSMDAFATFIKTNLTPQTLELIHFNEHTGQKWGVAGGKNVEGSGYYENPDAYGEHGDFGGGAHVHWATDVPPILPGINAPDVPSAAVPGGPTPPTPSPGTDAPNLGDISNQYDELPEFAKDAIIDTLVGTGLFASGAIARRVFGRRSRTGTPTAGQPNPRRPFEGQLPKNMAYTTREELARRAGYGVSNRVTRFEGSEAYRLGPFERRFTQPTMSGSEALNRLGISDPGTGGLRYGAFNEGLGPIQGPEVPPGFRPPAAAATGTGGWRPTAALRAAAEPTSVVGDLAAQQRAWMAEVNARPMIPGAALGNISELEARYMAQLIQGQNPGVPPPMPENLYNAAGDRLPYAQVMEGRLPQPGGGWRYPAQAPSTGGTGPTFRAPPTGGLTIPQEGVSPGLGAQTRGAFGSMGMGPISGPLSLLGAGFTAFGVVGQAQQLAEERRRQLGVQAIGPDGRPIPGTFADPTFGARRDIRIPDQPTGQFDNQGFGLRDVQTALTALAPLPTTILGSLFGGGGSPRPQAPAPAPAPPPVPAPARGWNVPVNPPAQVQGQQPSNAGQFRGVDPNQLRGPIAPAGPGPTAGLTGIDRLSQELINRRAAIGADTRTGLGTAAGSQPVHVTNPQQLPGGTQAPSAPTPQAPRPAQPAPPSQAPQPGQTPRPPQPPAGTPSPPAASGVGNFAANRNAGGIGDTYDVNNLPKPLPFNAQTPGDAFMSGMASMGNIASDAFAVFNDVIQNISDSAAIADMLVRGPANTEDVVGIIKHFQSFLKTAADVSKMVGDIGGMAGGASGGMDMGVGGGIQAVAGMISAGIEAVNQSITLGIDIYHQIGKYAGFIIGEFLGGDATGPLGGNVRMLLNTRTNELQTYSEDNPLNKNTFNVPLWQRSYLTQPTPPAVQIQQNLYVGPGQTPQQNMSDQMWAASTGAGAVSVAGHS
jgi:hypothetical protein